MTYTHLTTDELVMIESYFHQNQSISKNTRSLNRSRQTIYKVYRAFQFWSTPKEYFKIYKKNKSRCVRSKLILPDSQRTYIQNRGTQGWTPDVIIGRSEQRIDCSVRTLYRKFKDG